MATLREFLFAVASALHALLLDGVYCLADDSTPVFHPLPSLDTEDVADVLQVVRIRLLNLLERQGVIETRNAPRRGPDPG